MTSDTEIEDHSDYSICAIPPRPPEKSQIIHNHIRIALLFENRFFRARILTLNTNYCFIQNSDIQAIS